MADLYIGTIESEIEADLCACVSAAEDRYRREIEAVVTRLISEPARRVILLAGPSSSGKTTTAAMLAARLTALGHPAAVVSLDDFYRAKDDPAYPRHATGEQDYEAPDALHVSEIHDCIAAILRGESYALPHYDFRTASRITAHRVLTVPSGGYVIIEGLHALNPLLCEGLDRAEILKIFVSVSTNICARDGGRLLSGRKVRFLRRLSRDFLYRNADARRTYAMWQHVLHGEDLYLYPYKATADAAIDTFHRYEPGVLRPFTERLLSAPDAPSGPYIDTVRHALSLFEPLPLSVVPESSLLREFVPGGIFEEKA